MVNSTTETPKEAVKWHKNYSRLMPYYYVNHKAKLLFKNLDESEARLVRIRKIVKSTKELIVEVVEKIDVLKAEEKTSRKKLSEETLKVLWEEIEEISFQTLKTNKWTLVFVR